VKDRPKSWEELERVAGITRTVRPRPTQRDVANLTRKRLSKSPQWRRFFGRR
jgi:hypothetical protein